MTVSTSVSLVNSAEVARALASIDPKMRRNTAQSIIREAQPIVGQARVNASWSRRIPGAISIKPKFSGRYVGIYGRVSSAVAPHARPYEGVDGNDSFRHPVYGNDRWVSQKTRPFLGPAVQSAAPRVRSGIEQAISDALRV